LQLESRTGSAAGFFARGPTMCEQHDTRVSFSSVGKWFAMVVATALITFAGPVGCGGDDDGGDDDVPDSAVGDPPDAAPSPDGGSNPTPDAAPVEPPPPPDRLWVVPWEAAICPGQELELTATAIYEESGGGETHLVITEWVTWTTLPEGIATVDEVGLLEGVASGTTVVTGTYEGESDTLDLTVIGDDVGGIIVQPPTASVAAGLSVDFTATLVTNCGNFGDDVTATAEWTSSVTSVADLTAPGTFLSALQGGTTIRAIAQGHQDTSTLSVTPAVPVTLVVDPATVTLAPTETATLTATVTFSDDSQEDVTADAQWTSMLPAFVEVTGPGEIKGVAVGGTELHAAYSANGESAEGICAVTVTE